MTIVERLGSFYLGKAYDLANQTLLDSQIMYDARDLTTHAVCVGMTGSGKTGLCIDLLEDAAIDKVPAIIIDPKGDITNLLLTFPDLLPEDFQPWVNVDDARRKEMTVEEYAGAEAEKWRNGLADWDQGSERIRLLKESADFVIYTPGSNAGVPVSILSSLAAPDLDWEDSQEVLRERINGTVSALLGLAGIQADPVTSRDHILLSNIFEHAWRNGEDLDLPKLIMAIQDPPVRTLGVFDVDTFFPQKERFTLAMALNNIIASPAFASWLEGVPLDIDLMLYGSDARPNHSIFYIAHLSDAERMFFVTLLLEQMITWMRTQPGTTSLRALVYMDEVFGFFPPVSEPPSKRPMLTLLKQARAYGLGMVLTTQNPADLDYKGLTNAGTWFIGKLQAERDKERVLEGLESVSAEAGSSLDHRALDKMISSLGSRVFLLHNVHEDGPATFMTRWAMSYLRGPLTRTQVRELMADEKKKLDVQPAVGPPAEAGIVSSKPVHVGAKTIDRPDGMITIPEGLLTTPPALPHDLTRVYLPVTRSRRDALRELQDELDATLEPDDLLLIYEPQLLGAGTLRFVNEKRGVNERKEIMVLAQPPRSAGFVDWEEGEPVDLDFDDLQDRPEPGSLFVAEVPDAADSARELSRISKDFSDYLYRNFSFPLMYSPAFKLYSTPDENERAFKIRVQQAAREKRDAQVDKLAARFEKESYRVTTRLKREERELAEDQEDHEARKRDEWLGAGESIFNTLFGKRRSSTIFSSASRRRRMTASAKQDILESQEEIERLKEQLAENREDLEEQIEEIRNLWQDAVDEFEEYHVKPRRVDVDVHTVALAWVPMWEASIENHRGRLHTETARAF
ncbi:MAG: type IV secretion system DNA-binding domain-containing protein [Chloroflexota bacterium]|nr:type IV secretion system DNA-binding domain-containing protein [Chloroflexota bacterium]